MSPRTPDEIRAEIKRLEGAARSARINSPQYTDRDRRRDAKITRLRTALVGAINYAAASSSVPAPAYDGEWPTCATCGKRKPAVTRRRIAELERMYGIDSKERARYTLGHPVPYEGYHVGRLLTWFCTRKCGLRFAGLAADAGYRIERRTVLADD